MQDRACVRVGVNVGGWGSVRCKEERELARFGLLSCYVLFNRRINGALWPHVAFPHWATS